MRVAPVAPQHGAEGADFPLKRSGLDVRELLTAPDQVMVRSRTPAVALDLGLEHARGSMVRNQPADALAALDEVWSGARNTETGWYLRGGSLALLGLPGEALRVVAEGLQAHPDSAANQFLLSLTRLTLGDLPGAQLALANAGPAGEDVLLLVQRALVAAESGDPILAEELLRRASVAAPGHAALQYGRDTLRETQRNRTRDFKRTPVASRTPVSIDALFRDEVATDDGARAEHTGAASRAPAMDARYDATAVALRTLGNQLTNGTRKQVLAEARALIASLSAGGTLATTIPASRAHAARAVLSAVLEVLSGNTTGAVGWEAESIDGQWQRSTPAWSSNVPETDTLTRGNESLLNTVRGLVTAMRDGNPDGAEQQLRRAQGSVDDTSLRLLRAMLSSETEVEFPTASTAPGGEPATAYIRNGAPGHALLAPLRLGLALLPEDEGMGRKPRVTNVTDEAVMYSASLGAVSSSLSGADMRGVPGSAGSLVAAIGLLAAAVLAFSASLPVVGIACAGGGAWLALRKGSRTP